MNRQSIGFIDLFIHSFIHSFIRVCHLLDMTVSNETGRCDNNVEQWTDMAAVLSC